MSTIPATLDRLVALAEAAWPDVQRLDGGPTTQIEDDVICIGYSGVTGEADVRSTMTTEQLEMQPDLEQYDVMCLVSAWRGDAHDADGQPDARTTRARAFELLSGLRAELASDSRLGGTVMQARMSTVDVVQDQTPGGPVCTIRFSVHVIAFSEA